MANADSTADGFLFDTGPVMRRCRMCGERKALAAFYRWRMRSGRIRTARQCRSCDIKRMGVWHAENPESGAAAHRAWAAKNPEKIAVSKRVGRLRQYNLSQADYIAMLHAQGGVCAICRQPETVLDHRTKNPKSLAVDHDHRTGAVRALLCARCNYSLGLVNDDVPVLESMIAYLKRHAAQRSP